jgi:MoaA/NifB/PqqE/SkfB family radical SAM enzyme
MDTIIENLLNWYDGIKSSPEMVQIYPTNKCNLKCIFCVQRLNIYNLKEEVSKKRWLEVIEEICKMGVKKFLISGGGEPLSTPDKTFSIMKLIKSYNGEGRIITNGVLWNELFIKKTISMGWNWIMFSLHGANPETHDFLTSANGTFNKVIKNLELFLKYKRKMNCEIPSLEFTFVLNKCNFKEVPEMIKLANDFGIESVNIEPMCINNKDAEKIKLNEKDRKLFFKKILPEAKKLAKKLGIRNNFSKLEEFKLIEKAGELRNEIIKLNSLKKPSKSSLLNSPCYEPWLWPKIEANGEVWPCSTIQMKTTNIKERNFKEIWYGEEFNKFRARILNFDLPEECKNCVITHIPMQKEIRKNLNEFIKLSEEYGSHKRN